MNKLIGVETSYLCNGENLNCCDSEMCGTKTGIPCDCYYTHHANYAKHKEMVTIMDNFTKEFDKIRDHFDCAMKFDGEGVVLVLTEKEANS